jgi:acylphosphatase
MKRLHMCVAGRVQGVCFRMGASDEAERLGLTGWVRNLPDGRVETVAEGAAEAVETYQTWFRHGPSYAIVRDFTEESLPATGEFASFRVIH